MDIASVMFATDCTDCADYTCFILVIFFVTDCMDMASVMFATDCTDCADIVCVMVALVSCARVGMFCK
jgi:hypothetical protein